MTLKNYEGHSLKNPKKITNFQPFPSRFSSRRHEIREVGEVK